jgi:7-keto-8-aminopelargonate synthetase-like enzyme
MSDLFHEQLQTLCARSMHRKLREIGSAQGSEVRVVGQQLINFSSNDYLGLANHPRLREAATAAIAEFGVGAGSSRLISGTQSPHVRLETALAQWKGTQAALSFSSGYAGSGWSDPGPCREKRRRPARQIIPRVVDRWRQIKRRDIAGFPP